MRSLIVGAAIEMLKQIPVSGLTVDGVAKQANILGRAIFRDFASRDALLDRYWLLPLLLVEVNSCYVLPCVKLEVSDSPILYVARQTGPLLPGF
jgi:hypothetical protein